MGKCGECRYWFELPEEGQCRRHAPKMIMAGCGTGDIPEYSNDWATIGKDDWCGEFEEIQEELKIMKKPIEFLELSTRAHFALLSDYGNDYPAINTIGELIVCDRRALLNRPRLGNVSLREIVRKLSAVGLHLAVEAH